MRNTAVARFVVFVVIHVLLCVSAALHAGEYSSMLLQLESPESVYIDGADFSGLFDLLTFAAGGMVSAVISVIAFAAMTVFSVILLLPFRFISVRKFTIITRWEKNATLTVILAGAALALLVSLIYGGGAAISGCLLFLLPALLIEILMYWLTLYFRCRK